MLHARLQVVDERVVDREQLRDLEEDHVDVVHRDLAELRVGDRLERLHVLQRRAVNAGPCFKSTYKIQ